jgi:hypothetical protein
MAQTLRHSTSASNPQTGTNQPKASGAGDQKKDAPGQDTKAAAGKEPDDDRSVSPEEKRQQAMSLVEDALAGANGISLIECKVLTQVEGAIFLWPSDQARARSLFQEAVNAARQFLEEEKKTRVYKMSRQMRTYEEREGRAGRLWFAVLRKIAAISPALLQELTADQATAGKVKEAIYGVWTEEARAIINAAYDQIEKDPALAARLAEQSLARGVVDWAEFLRTLSRRDVDEAERLATVIIDRLRDSSLTPLSLKSLSRFVFLSGRSSNLQDHFLQALLIRLRRDLHPGTARRQLEDNLRAAKDLIPAAAKYAPRLQPEFERLALESEQLSKSLALPPPAPPKTITIKMPQPTAVPGNTSEIWEALTPAAKITEAQVRDKQYQKLATEAALKADLKLAEDMLWRISNEDLRRETTLEVYSPLVRKALGEADWVEAQRLALKVQDPLGRTLMLDQLGQTMLQAKQKQEKGQIIEIYRLAIARLERDETSISVAKAWLLLLQSLFRLDPQGGVGEIGSAIAALNRLSESGELFQEPALSQALSNWVKLPNYTLSAGEVLYLPELLSKAFGEMARQDENRALALAAELSPSLRPLAQLAVSREMLAKTKASTGPLPETAK